MTTIDEKTLKSIPSPEGLYRRLYALGEGEIHIRDVGPDELEVTRIPKGQAPVTGRIKKEHATPGDFIRALRSV